MRRVLFIGSGNSCRSAAAEYVLRKMLAERRCRDVDVSSAGTVDWGINPRDAEMVRIAAEHGYKIKGKTRPMRPGMGVECGYTSASVAAVSRLRD